MSNHKISDVGINIAEKATVIWNVADMLADHSSRMSMILLYYR